MQQTDARLRQQEVIVKKAIAPPADAETESAPNIDTGILGSRSDVDTRVLGKPNQYSGPTKFADPSFKIRAHLGAVDQRYQEEFQTAEASAMPRPSATLTWTLPVSAHAVVPHPRDDDVRVCHWTSAAMLESTRTSWHGGSSYWNRSRYGGQHASDC